MKHATTLLLTLMLSAMATTVSANKLTAEFVNKEIDYAHTQYLNGSPETAKYALEALARLLESDQSKTLRHDTGPNALALTYARLGLLYDKSGSTVKASDYKAKSISLLQRNMTGVSWEGIVKLLHVLDSPRN